MQQRVAPWIALAAIVAAPSAFSLNLLSFLHAKELVYAVAALLLAVVAALPVPSGKVLKAPRWFCALALWCLAMCAISLLRGAHWHAPLEKLVHAWLVLLLAALVLRSMPPGAPALRNALVASGALASLLGILQYAHAIDYFLPVFPHYDQRMYSVFGNQDLLGGYAALCLPLALAAAPGISPSRRVLNVFAVLLLVVALLLSNARSAWLAAAISLAPLALRGLRAAWKEKDPIRRAAQLRRTEWYAFAAAMILVVSAPLWGPRIWNTYGPNDTGGNLRSWFYLGTWDMIRAHPWLGVGFGQYGLNSPRHMGAVLHAPGGEHLAHNTLFVDHAHSDPLELVAESGALGALLLGALLLVSLRRHRLAQHGLPEAAALAALAVFACLNPAFISAPHAVAGLLCLATCLQRDDAQAANRNLGIPTAIAAAGLVAAWCWLSLLPGWSYVRANDLIREHSISRGEALNDVMAFEAYANIARRFHAPPAAFEAAMDSADVYARSGEYAAHATLVRELLEEAFRVSDTGNLHLAAARYFQAIGDDAAAQQAQKEVEARWPGVDAGP